MTGLEFILRHRSGAWRKYSLKRLSSKLGEEVQPSSLKSPFLLLRPKVRTGYDRTNQSQVAKGGGNGFWSWTTRTRDLLLG